MFKKNSPPQRKSFSLNKEDLIHDIGVITLDESESRKLFLCLDEKPPQEHIFSKLEEFLKGTSNLEDVSKSLTGLVREVEHLKTEINEKVSDLKNEEQVVTR